MDTSDVCHVGHVGMIVRDGYVSVLQDETHIPSHFEGVRSALAQVLLLYAMHVEAYVLWVGGYGL